MFHLRFILCALSLLVSFSSPANIRVRLSPEELALMDEKAFVQEMESWRARGMNKIVIEPPRPPKQIKLRSRNFTPVKAEAENGAELYYFVSVGNSTSDESIRSDDYAAMYRVLTTASLWRFRITVNLNAMASDLRGALEARVPTVIFWASHGNPQGFYDSRSAKIPEQIFKDASPMVYQLILSSCHGRQALDEVYLKHAPKGLKTWAWTGLTYRRDLKNFVDNQFNIFENLPDFSYNNLQCLSEEKGTFMTNGKKRLNDFAFKDRNECLRYTLLGRDGFVCLRSERGGKSTTYSVAAGEATLGDHYDDINDCINRLGSIRQGRVCRRQDKNVYLINRDNAVEKEYPDMDQCLAELGGQSL